MTSDSSYALLPRALRLLSVGLVLSTVVASASEPISVVVTTSLIECAVGEVTASCPGHFRVVRLVPPGACPGHFDISPRSLPRLRAARLIVRHDFQKVLDTKLHRLGAQDLETVSVSSEGSLLIPANYAAVVRQVADALILAAPELRHPLAEAARASIIAAERLAEHLREQARPWIGTPVIASSRQRAFCEWLGLSVMGVLPLPEDMTPRVLGKLKHKQARMVVGNLQSDRKAATSLARRMAIPVAVLSNFPGSKGYGKTFSDLHRHNMERLETAWRKNR